MWRARSLLLTLAVVGCADDAADPGGGFAPPDIALAPAETFDPRIEPEPPAPACVVAPAGTILLERFVAEGGLDVVGSVATDDEGNVAITHARDPLAPPLGIHKLARNGDLVYGKPYGVVATLDAAGNAYVAAPFTGELDLGLGPMHAKGVLDVFVAKLDPTGAVVFAQPLHLYGAGLAAIAVGGDGRIALSGRELGTIVLAPNGRDVLLHKYFAGDVAFDAEDNVIIAGGFAGSLYLGAGVTLTTPGDEDGFVVKYAGCDGCYVWHAVIGDPPLGEPAAVGQVVAPRTRQAVTAVAVDGDDVIIAGEADGGAHVLGDVLRSQDGGIVAPRGTGFVAKLTPDGGKAWTAQLAPVEDVADVAIDRFGNVFVSGAQHFAPAPSLRSPLLVQLSPSGGVLYSQGAKHEGSAHALATDACGDVFVLVSEYQGAALPWRTSLRKLAFWRPLR